MPREHDFNTAAKKDAWIRQHGKCACCGKNLEEAAQKQGELPNAHHAVPNQSGDISREQSPWMRSQDNCVYVCNDCHHKVHEEGKYKIGAVAEPDQFRYSHGKPNSKANRDAHAEWEGEVNSQWEKKQLRYHKSLSKSSEEKKPSHTKSR